MAFVRPALQDRVEAAGESVIGDSGNAPVRRKPGDAARGGRQRRDRRLWLGSSLAYLKNFPAAELKIDKAFVLDIADSQKDSMLARSTIDLGHSLGMQVTAEGVETEMALSLLALMGCDAAQGYFISRPMPLDDLLKFLKRDPAQEMQIASPGLAVVVGNLRSVHS
jgi:hypothetical protein